MVERFNWYLEAIGCEMWLVFFCPWTIMLRFQQYYSKFPRLIWMLTHKCIAENWFEFHLFKPIPKNLLLISFECANTLPISLWHERIRICTKEIAYQLYQGENYDWKSSLSHFQTFSVHFSTFSVFSFPLSCTPNHLNSST